MLPAIACDLTREEIQSRRAGLLPGLIADALERIELEGGYRWRFEPSSEFLDRVRQHQSRAKRIRFRPVGAVCDRAHFVEASSYPRLRRKTRGHRPDARTHLTPGRLEVID
jgi:hypothetical protein